MKIISKANENFSHGLYGHLTKGKENLIFCPVSISTVLAILRNGANEEIKKEIQKTLQLPVEEDDGKTVNKLYLHLLESFNHDHGHFLFKSTNKIYVQKNLKISDEFLNSANKYFLSEISHVDFHLVDKSGHEINVWAEKHTNEILEHQHLITHCSLNSKTQMVLVNAVYFNVLWRYPFNVSQTTKEKFYRTSSSTKEVDMMKLGKKLGFLHLKNSFKIEASVVEIPFAGNRFSMLVYLPQSYESSDFEHLEVSLSNILIQDIINNMGSSYHNVILWLPKFRIKSDVDFLPALHDLGLKKSINIGPSHFGNISEDAELFVSTFVQKSFIEVNEVGTKAAPPANDLEAVQQRRASLVPEEHFIEFKVDRPFCFQIFDKETGFIVLAGKCTNPTY